jgi:CheY-like chemotaxis protein
VQKGHGMAREQPLSFEWRDGAIRVLFVEDDDGFREALSWQLAESGFSVQGFADGNALLAAWSGQTFQLSSEPIWVRPIAVAISVR